MVLALASVAIVLAIALPASLHLVLSRITEMHEATLEHLERTQVIGGQPVKLADQSLELQKEKARVEHQRLVTAKSPAERVGS